MAKKIELLQFYRHLRLSGSEMTPSLLDQKIKQASLSIKVKQPIANDKHHTTSV